MSMLRVLWWLTSHHMPYPLLQRIGLKYKPEPTTACQSLCCKEMEGSVVLDDLGKAVSHFER